MLDELGRFPEVGETVTIDSWSIEIRDIERHRIRQVALRHIPEPEDADPSTS